MFSVFKKFRGGIATVFVKAGGWDDGVTATDQPTIGHPIRMRRKRASAKNTAGCDVESTELTVKESLSVGLCQSLKRLRKLGKAERGGGRVQSGLRMCWPAGGGPADSILPLGIAPCVARMY